MRFAVCMSLYKFNILTSCVEGEDELSADVQGLLTIKFCLVIRDIYE